MLLESSGISDKQTFIDAILETFTEMLPGPHMFLCSLSSHYDSGKMCINVQYVILQPENGNIWKNTEYKTILIQWSANIRVSPQAYGARISTEEREANACS